MSNTDTSICNRALAHIGTRSQIASLTENSPEARACNMFYEETRNEVLSMAYWNFANKTATLSVLKVAPGTPGAASTNATVWNNTFPPPPWLYEYAYPDDCIQMMRILAQFDTGFTGVPIFTTATSIFPANFVGYGPAVPYKVSTDTPPGQSSGPPTNVILTNQYQAIAVYTQLITNPALFSGQFVEALSCAIAAKISMQLTGDKALMNSMYQLANTNIVAARQSDGNEGLTIIDQQASWIECREDWGYYGAGSPYSTPYSALYSVL